jgi:aminopeptidase-like protein
MQERKNIGEKIYELACELFPINRSITGQGVRETLRILQRELSDLQIHEVPSGTPCFDWSVPKEWNICDAYIIGPDGKKIADFHENNLHVVGYSTPVDKTVSLSELKRHLYSLPEQPDAIPYVTSYYEERWGFCIEDKKKALLKKGEYKVYIDSTLKHGSLTYGEIIIPGNSEKEVFLSTYICHPSMANNEVSGPVVTTFLGKWLQSLRSRKYTYRIVFVPETIGSIAYISFNLGQLKKHVIAGFNVTCVGDERAYSYLPSRSGNTLADRVAIHVLNHISPDFKKYSYFNRGSDERQYCSPGVDLPVVSVMRSKYREYPEYHTSKDDLDFISPEGLFGGYNSLKQCIICLERNETLCMSNPCEPQLGKRNLHPTLGARDAYNSIKIVMGLIGYCDGTKDLLEIAERTGLRMQDLFETVDKLKEEGLLLTEDNNWSDAG